MQLTQKETPDPRTMARQEHLFGQAEQYARQSPFQQQYGYGKQMVPGMGGMSQTGQQYLTDKILGKGAYGYQNLGFQDYRRPEKAPIGGYQYGGTGLGVGQNEAAIAQSYKGKESYETALQDPSAWYAYMRSRHGDNFEIKDEHGVAVDLGTWNTKTRDQQQALIRAQTTPEQTWEYGNPFGGQTWMSESDWRQEFANPNSALKSYFTDAAGNINVGDWQGTTGGTRALGLAGEAPYQEGMPGLPQTGYGTVTDDEGNVLSHAGEWNPWARGYPEAERPPYEQNLWMDQAQPPFGEQNLPDATSAEDYQAQQLASLNSNISAGGELSRVAALAQARALAQAQAGMPGLLQTDLPRPTSGVGIGEIEDARTATRRMLTQAGPGGVPGYNQFLPGGWTGLDKAGTGTAPDETYISTLGSQGVPAADLIRGLPGSREFGVEAPTDITGIPDIAAQDIADVGEGYAGDAVTAGGLAGTEPNVRVDPLTGAVTQDVLGVAPTPIAAPGEVTVDPVTGEITQAVADVTPGAIAGPGGVTVDPITGQVTQAVADVDPTAFTGASFLGGDLGAYMDVGGVESQVTAAQQAYQQAQNVEQARRAQSHAWGTRGDIPRAEQEAQMLARISEIRRKGYTEAADRMEADLQRQQAAGMQTQQLTAQTGMQAQQLEAQRRESDAARAQQALIQGQQLGTQADLQYQQLAQQGGIRGAELGLQAQMQGQQLEAQRRSEDAARAQQAALSGQQLGTQAALQTQQLGQAGGIRAAELDAQIGLAGQQLQAQRREADAARSQQAAMQAQQLDTEARLQEQRLGTGRTQRKAELDLQAALANQQAALQSGNQTQQLEAQQAIRQAELDLEQQRATTGVGADVAMQQQQLQQQAGMQTAQNQLEAARADQQAAFQSGNAQAQYEAQRQMREAELRLQRGMQTQQLGAESAAQQTQNEFLRRQGLAEMGLQAQGMGMDDAARFRAQQMQASQQLAGLGGMEQAATFGAAQQLAQMGGTQEQRQQMQAAADYEQWLRSQEGFADEAAFLQAMQPQAGMAQYQRKPSVWGQVAGGLLAGAGTAAQMGAFGSDARIKDNIEYVGMENGFKTYEFNYLGRDNRYKGVMAQEVMVERPDAVEIQDGFYRVNYDAIGVQFEAV